ncbi:hypothetical protein PR048_009077 [Dryococelus australis]|uniref:Uncharacterized protein n=1 Tax=Dryococelus australis TaxID=614101 RepID=A0ABQ9HYV8_9NEOP|nr:hypothetical protein PR048_009077 [Dryococelus australis]
MYLWRPLGQRTLQDGCPKALSCPGVSGADKYQREYAFYKIENKVLNSTKLLQGPPIRSNLPLMQEGLKDLNIHSKVIKPLNSWSSSHITAWLPWGAWTSAARKAPDSRETLASAHAPDYFKWKPTYAASPALRAEPALLRATTVPANCPGNELISRSSPLRSSWAPCEIILHDPPLPLVNQADVTRSSDDLDQRHCSTLLEESATRKHVPANISFGVSRGGKKVLDQGHLQYKYGRSWRVGNRGIDGLERKDRRQTHERAQQQLLRTRECVCCAGRGIRQVECFCGWESSGSSRLDNEYCYKMPEGRTQINGDIRSALGEERTRYVGLSRRHAATGHCERSPLLLRENIPLRLAARLSNPYFVFTFLRSLGPREAEQSSNTVAVTSRGSTAQHLVRMGDVAMGTCGIVARIAVPGTRHITLMRVKSMAGQGSCVRWLARGRHGDSRLLWIDVARRCSGCLQGAPSPWSAQPVRYLSSHTYLHHSHIHATSLRLASTPSPDIRRFPVELENSSRKHSMYMYPAPFLRFSRGTPITRLMPELKLANARIQHNCLPTSATHYTHRVDESNHITTQRYWLCMSQAAHSSDISRYGKTRGGEVSTIPREQRTGEEAALPFYATMFAERAVGSRTVMFRGSGENPKAGLEAHQVRGDKLGIGNQPFKTFDTDTESWEARQGEVSMAQRRNVRPGEIPEKTHCPARLPRAGATPQGIDLDGCRQRGIESRRGLLRRVWSSAGMKGRGKREIPEKTRRTEVLTRHDSHLRKSCAPAGD